MLSTSANISKAKEANNAYNTESLFKLPATLINFLNLFKTHKNNNELLDYDLLTVPSRELSSTPKSKLKQYHKVGEQYESIPCKYKYKGCAASFALIWDLVCLLPGVLGPRPSHTWVWTKSGGFGCPGVLADPETRVGRYIASITDHELPMNGHHHLDPQVTGDSHMLDLFRSSWFFMHLN